MSTARRAEAQILFDGVDISKDLKKYLLSVEYTDSEGIDEADDLQISLQDRSGIWQAGWLQSAVEAAANRSRLDPALSSLTIQAKILKYDGTGGRPSVLDCGKFQLDAVSVSGPPDVITIKGTSVPYHAAMRNTKVERTWKGQKLTQIAQTLAKECRLGLKTYLKNDPAVSADQNNEANAAFLARICRKYGIRCKMTDNAIVLYENDTAAIAGPVRIDQEDVISKRMDAGRAQTEYQICRVWYVPPGGSLIEGKAYTDDYDKEKDDNLQLDWNTRVGTKAEAEAIARHELALHNSYALSGSVTVPGDFRLLGGTDVELWGFGFWSGDYIAASAKHTVSDSGYVTEVSLRKNPRPDPERREVYRPPSAGELQPI